MFGGFTFGASPEARRSSSLGGRAGFAVFQDETPGFRSEMPGGRAPAPSAAEPLPFDPVLLQLAPEGRAADPEGLGRPRVIPACALERLHDEDPLGLGHGLRRSEIRR